MQWISEGMRHRMIAEAAYFRAERRGFKNGDPATDWIEAERELSPKLSAADEMEATHQERLIIANEWLKGIRKKLSQASKQAQEEWESDVEKLAKLRDRFIKQVHAIQGKTGPAADKARDNAEATWKKVESILDRFSKRKLRH